MSEMSNYLENALINATLRNVSFTSPATVYVALFTSDPGDGGTGTEVSGGSYTRQSVAFSAPSNGATANSATVEFAQATASWGTIGWVGLYDASTGGNLLYHSPLEAAKTIATGDVFRISAGSLTVTLS